MLAEAQAVLDRADTMLVERPGFFGADGKIVIAVFIRQHGARIEEGDLLIQHSGITQCANVAASSKWKPEVVIRDTRAHPPPERRMPPMLHVPLAKLPGGGAKKLLSKNRRLGMNQR